jgi:hypothetical protein
MYPFLKETRKLTTGLKPEKNVLYEQNNQTPRNNLSSHGAILKKKKRRKTNSSKGKILNKRRKG